MDIGFWVRQSSRRTPSSIAVKSAEGERTYAQLHDRSIRLAGALRSLGLVPGERVLVLLENRLEYPEIDLGIVTGGLVRVALNARLKLADFEIIAEDSGARAIITESAFDADAASLAASHGLTWIRLDDEVAGDADLAYEALLASVPATMPDTLPTADDVAWISFTSGTTGRPKGVVLTHRAITEVARNILMGLGPVAEDSGILLPQPVSHGAGYFVLPYLAAGATVRIMGKFDPAEVGAISINENIGTLKCVPDMLKTMTAHEVPAAFSSIIYGAAPIATPQLESALALYGPVLTQIYGQSEAPATLTCLTRADHARPGDHRNSAGRPWPFVATRVVDPDGASVGVGEVGELIISALHQMLGYHGRPDLTAQVLKDGWIWTKDMAYADDEGFIHLQGRRDDMINSGGFNIAPREVENVLTSHPAVSEAAVIGIPDERWGQAVMAYVVGRAGQVPTREELDAYCEPLLTFRRPRRIEIIERLPRNTYGKVDLAHLRAAAAQARGVSS